MRTRFLLVLIVLGVFIASQVGYVLAGGMGSVHGKNEMQPVEKSTEIEAPLLAPTDYLEWLESHEGIENGVRASPGSGAFRFLSHPSALRSS